MNSSLVSLCCIFTMQKIPLLLNSFFDYSFFCRNLNKSKSDRVLFRTPRCSMDASVGGNFFKLRVYYLNSKVEDVIVI